MIHPVFDPFPVLETPRLLMRSLTKKDAPHQFAIRTNEESMKYLDRDHPADIAEVEEMIRQMEVAAKENRAINWAVELKSDGSFIGTVGYYRNDFANHRGEIGYQLHPDHFGKGYGTEAVGAALDHGFRVFGFHTVAADINPANEASRALLRKLGFIKEAYFRENFFHKGKFLDSEIHCLTSSDHNKNKQHEI